MILVKLSVKVTIFISQDCEKGLLEGLVLKLKLEVICMIKTSVNKTFKI